MMMAILTISRDFRSGSREIGSAVAKVLNYQYVSKETILQDMKAAGERWERVGRKLDEIVPSFWERYDWEYQGFVALVESYIYEHALGDNVIIVGRGGNYLLQGIPYVLMIRLTAAKDKRIERVMLEDRMDYKTASLIIDRMDRNRAGFIHTHYGRKWDDPENYDMVLNTGIETYEQVTKILVDALREKASLATPEARKMLAARALAARVRAGVLTDRRFHLPTLEVSSDGESVILQGIVHNVDEHRAVEELAQKIAAPTRVHCKLHYRTR
jgi:cytidylate kinase